MAVGGRQAESGMQDMNDRRKTWYRLTATVAAVLLAASVAAAAENSATPGRLNILFLLVDDLGWADLGCYGADLHETPHLDRLAKSAVRFTNAYAAAPVCTPTRAAILTGKHPARLRMTVWREATQTPPRNRKVIPPVVRADLPHEEVTLAEVLQAASYLTAHVGKWHLGEASHFPETHGFDIHVGGNHWGAPATFFHPYRGLAAKEFRYVPHLAWGRAGEYLTDRLTDEAIQVIDKAKDQPFFLNLWHYGVHTPIQAKTADVEYFTKKRKPGMRHQNATYAAMVKNLDDNVGRLLAKLDERKLTERTVIVFTSDNGGYLGNPKGETVTSNHPLRSGKGSLYEGGIRVPLLVYWPGETPAGAVCAEPVTSTDFYRTLLDIAAVPDNVKRNTQSDGLSLVPLLKDPKARLDRGALYWHFPHYYPTTTPVSAVRRGDWKLLEYHEDGRVELYHLKDDLGEAADVAAKMPEKAADLRQRLEAWRKDVGAQMPAANPDFKGK